MKTKTKKIIGLILKLPLYALIFGSFIAAIYAAYAKIQGVTYATPIIWGAVIVAFIIGSILSKQEKSQTYQKYQPQQQEQ